MTDRNKVLSLPRHQMRNVSVAVGQCMNHLCGIEAAYLEAKDKTWCRIAHADEVLAMIADAEDILAEICVACGQDVVGFFDDGITPWEDRDTEDDKEGEEDESRSPPPDPDHLDQDQGDVYGDYDNTDRPKC